MDEYYNTIPNNKLARLLDSSIFRVKKMSEKSNDKNDKNINEFELDIDHIKFVGVSKNIENECDINIIYVLEMKKVNKKVKEFYKKLAKNMALIYQQEEKR